MKRKLYWLLSTLILLAACEKSNDGVLAAFDVYSEMVANRAKPVALHYPMEPSMIDRLWPEFMDIADKHQVQLYREDNFPNSLLFPAKITDGKTVVLIYNGKSLTQYLQLKKDLAADPGVDFSHSVALARRFGRLLGYTPQGINDLLARQTGYQNLHQASVEIQTTHLYYEDLSRAVHFYGNTLGLEQVDDTTYRISEHALLSLHSHSETHPVGQPKSTAIAFLTDQLPAWYEYVQSQNIPIKYTYKPRDGGPHDGFVAIDPEGYLLEFEEFKQHSENEVFMSILENTQRVKTKIDGLHFFGSITWTYHKDLLKVQNFYQDVLGYELVADQGWTKIFQTAESAFVGLVDERRGMEDYADTKAVEITWQVARLNELDVYASQHWPHYRYSNGSFQGPEGYRYTVLTDSE